MEFVRLKFLQKYEGNMTTIKCIKMYWAIYTLLFCVRTDGFACHCRVLTVFMNLNCNRYSLSFIFASLRVAFYSFFKIHINLTIYMLIQNRTTSEGWVEERSGYPNYISIWNTSTYIWFQIITENLTAMVNLYFACAHLFNEF